MGRRFEKVILSGMLWFALLSLGSCQSKAKAYVVTWLNDDGMVIETEEVLNGDTPTFHGDVPSKPSTAQYVYTFSGWSEEPSPIYSDTSYTAIYTSSTRKYRISWLDEDGSLIKTSMIAYGEYPQYDGDLPLKKDTASNSYSFSSWKPALQEVTGDASYTASYKPTAKQYCVTWKNEDGSVLKTSNFEYGSKPVYDGQTPTKPSDSYNNYSFSSWYPDITDDTFVTKDIAYTAVFSSSIRTATIRWVNEDGSLLKQDNDVPYGTLPSFGQIMPTKESDASHTYEFAGWEPAIHSVMGDVTYKATFVGEVKKFNVRWLNFDGSLLFEDCVPYGATPIYQGALPYHPSDEQYSYTFVGWDKAVSSIYEDTVYQAKFNKSERKYTVKWVDYNGALLETDEEVGYGETPTYDGTEPTRNEDSLYSYTFSGWKPAVGPVNGDITYRATYSKQESSKKYTVKWINDNGEILKVDYLAFGSLPSYQGEEPTKKSNVQYSYSFEGWDKDITPVKGDVTYLAKFKQITRKYSVNWLDSDGSLLKTEQIEYGKTPEIPQNPPKKEDSDYRYTFESWSPTISVVQGDQTYTAQYQKDVLYTIKFVNWDGTILSTQRTIFGETPVYSGSSPTRSSSASSTFSYEFDGWSPKVTPTNKDQTYTAKYREVAKKYQVTWKNYDGSTLATEEYSMNKTPYYKNANPTRAADMQYKYSFSGWSPELTKVTQDVTYVAQYDKTLCKAYVAFDLRGGTTSSDTKARYSDLTDGKDLFYDVSKEGYAFRGWSYNGERLFDEKGNKLIDKINLSEKMILKAEFGAYHTFTVENESSIGGSLDGSGNYAYGQTVTATATPEEGYKFDGWKYYGNTVSTTEQYSFEMPDRDYKLTGSFSLESYKLIVGTHWNCDITVEVNGSPVRLDSSLGIYVKYTYRVQVTAKSNNSSIIFLGWYDDEDKRVSTLPVYSFSMPHRRYELTAKFKRDKSEE